MTDRQARLTDIRPDLTVLMVGAVAGLVRRLQVSVHEAGLVEARPQYGYVVRALAAQEMTLTELAELLGVTKQAAAKLVDEMVAGGYVRRAGDEGDRRRKRLLLDERGRRLVASGHAFSERVEAELRRDLGPEVVEAVRTVCLHLMEQQGELDNARAERVRPVW